MLLVVITFFQGVWHGKAVERHPLSKHGSILILSKMNLT